MLVRVVDAADQPVDSAFVRLRETRFPGREFEGAASESNQGVVRFDNVFEGPVSAEASDVYARGGRGASVLSGPGATLELKVRLSMTGRVSGTFVQADGVTPAAVAGYPNITVPAGFIHGLPIGISFFSTAYQEPTLIKLAYAFEQASRVRKPPQFLPTVSFA